jgi:hypothetical protein
MALMTSLSLLWRALARKARFYTIGWRLYILPIAILAGGLGIFHAREPAKAKDQGTALTEAIKTAFDEFATVGHKLSAELTTCRFDLRFDCIRYPSGFDGFDPWSASSLPPIRVSNSIPETRLCEGMLPTRVYTIEDYRNPPRPEPPYFSRIIGYRCRDAGAPPPRPDGTRTAPVTGRTIDDKFACYNVDPVAQGGWSILCHPRAPAPWSFLGGEWESHVVPVADDSGVGRRIVSGLAYYGEKGLGLFLSPLNIKPDQYLGSLATFIFVVLMAASIVLTLLFLSAGLDRFGPFILLMFFPVPLVWFLVTGIPTLIIAGLGAVFAVFLSTFNTAWAGWLYLGAVYGAFIGPFKAVFKVIAWGRRFWRKPRPSAAESL